MVESFRSHKIDFQSEEMALPQVTDYPCDRAGSSG